MIAFTKAALRIYIACLLLFGIQMACQITFTSIGYAKASIVIAVMRKFILLIPLIYFCLSFCPSTKLGQCTPQSLWRIFWQ